MWEIPVPSAQFVVNLKVLIKIKFIDIFKRKKKIAGMGIWEEGRKAQGEKFKTVGSDYLTTNQSLG